MNRMRFPVANAGRLPDPARFGRGPLTGTHLDG